MVHLQTKNKSGWSGVEVMGAGKISKGPYELAAVDVVVNDEPKQGLCTQHSQIKAPSRRSNVDGRDWAEASFGENQEDTKEK